MSDKLPLAMRVEEITPRELDVLAKAGETPSPTVERIRGKMRPKVRVAFERTFEKHRAAYEYLADKG